jgi:hypothetical protein
MPAPLGLAGADASAEGLESGVEGVGAGALDAVPAEAEGLDDVAAASADPMEPDEQAVASSAVPARARARTGRIDIPRR